MALGGARPGAGRPRLEASKLREAIIRKAEERAEELAQAIIDKALDSKSLGDVPALKEIFDRGIGKVVQGVDHTTNGKDLPQPIINLNALSGDDSDKKDSEAQGKD